MKRYGKDGVSWGSFGVRQVKRIRLLGIVVPSVRIIALYLLLSCCSNIAFKT